MKELQTERKRQVGEKSLMENIAVKILPTIKTIQRTAKNVKRIATNFYFSHEAVREYH